MALRPQPPRKMPSELAELGAKLLSSASPYRLIGETLYEKYNDADFAYMYSNEGKVAISPVDLLFVSALQALENLSDRAAAQALQLNIGWKYALHLPLDFAGFDFSVLSEFRDRLIKNDAQRVLFEGLLTQFSEMGLVKKRGRQRTDSLAVFTHIRQLNRLELQAETLRLAIQAVQKAAPDFAKTHLPTQWGQRYGQRLVAERLSESECAALSKEVGVDGQWFLNLLHAQHSPAPLSTLSEVEVLKRVWAAQFIIVEGKITLRPKDEPPADISGGIICSPHDPQVRWSKKRDEEWQGYKLQATQSFDEDYPSLIVDIGLTESTQNDQTALGVIAERQAAAETLPRQRLVDKGYTGGPNLLAAEKREEELIGPLSKHGGPQAKLPDGIMQHEFSLAADEKTVTCPGGQQSLVGRKDSEGNLHFRFAKQVCAACPLRARCCSTDQGRRLQYSRYYPQYEKARQRMKDPETKKLYKKRGGVEGCLSFLVRGQGVRRTRYIGLVKNDLRMVFAGIGANLKLVGRWLAGKRPQKRGKNRVALAFN